MTVSTILSKIITGKLLVDPRNRRSQRDISYDYVKQLMMSLILLPRVRKGCETDIRKLMIQTQDPIRFKISDGKEYISNGSHRIMSFLVVLLGILPMPASLDSNVKYFLVDRDEEEAACLQGEWGLKESYDFIRTSLQNNYQPLINELTDCVPRVSSGVPMMISKTQAYRKRETKYSKLSSRCNST